MKIRFLLVQETPHSNWEAHYFGQTFLAANPCSRMKFMHIKFISDKKKFCWTHTEQHFALGSMPQDRHFLAKFLALFEKAAGRSETVVAGYTPNSRGINSYIKRVSQNNIGRLGVFRNFWRKKGIFFGPRFFWEFFM